jgi:uncharacterized protein (TIGR00369 family)
MSEQHRGGAGVRTGDEHDGDAVSRFVSVMRDLHDRLVVFGAPDRIFDEATGRIKELNHLLAQWAVPQGESPIGRRWDLPGRGHPLQVPMTIESVTDDELHARLAFRSSHVGVTGSVHGGLLPLVFDEAFGTIVSRSYSPVVTGYLKVDYRNPTPAGVTLQLRARVTEVAGRKVLLSGEIHDGRRLLVEAESLMVQLRDHQ